jgi:TfoX/Sxy family transcriptional regulator of competence genes
MAYNVELEKQIDPLAARLGIDVKKKMFGGIGYLKSGKMAFGIHKNWLIVRTTPEKAAELLKLKGVKVFDITGRPMKGWLMIEPASLETTLVLQDLLELGVEFISASVDRP